MSSNDSFQIPSKSTAVVTYWLFQGLVVIVGCVTIVALFGAVTDIPFIVGLVLSAIIAVIQTLFVCDADRQGGAREIAPARRWTSYLTFGLCTMVLCAVPMGIALTLLAQGADEEAMVGVWCAGMVAITAWGTIWMRRSAHKDRRESRYRDAARALFMGSGLSLLGFFVLAIIAWIALNHMAVVGTVLVVASVPIISVTLVALGCCLYLNRLWTFRAPWYETHCAECGYDLAGDLNVSQCSECGTPWKHHETLPRTEDAAAQND